MTKRVDITEEPIRDYSHLEIVNLRWEPLPDNLNDVPDGWTVVKIEGTFEGKDYRALVPVSSDLLEEDKGFVTFAMRQMLVDNAIRPREERRIMGRDEVGEND